MGILGNIFSRSRLGRGGSTESALAGHSESSSTSDAANVASSAGVSDAPTVDTSAQRFPESRPHLPTVDMPANSDSLELQSIGQAASGAQRMSDGVTHRHPTQPPLSAKGGNMPSIAGRRNAGRPMSKAITALSQAGRRIIGRSPLGGADRNTTPVNYVQLETSPVWLERSADTDVTDQSPDGPATTPARRTVIRRRSTPGPKAVVRRKEDSPATVAGTTPRRPGRPRRPLGRAAATVIRRRPELEAMPKVRRKSEKPIRPTLGKGLSERKTKPMASPDRWRPQEMGPSDEPDTGSASMAGTLEGPVGESRSLSLKPVAQRERVMRSIDSATSIDAPDQALPATASEVSPSDERQPVDKPTKKNILAPGQDFVFRKSVSASDAPKASKATDSAASPKTISSAPTVVRRAKTDGPDKPTPGSDNTRRKEKLVPERPAVTADVAKSAPTSPVEGNRKTDGALSSPAQAQRITKVPTPANSGPVIDVPSRVVTPESTDQVALAPATPANSDKGLLNSARDLIFRKTAPQSDANFSKPNAEVRHVESSAPATSQPAQVQRSVSTDPQPSTSQASSTVSENEPESSERTRPKPSPASTVSRLVRRSVNMIARAPQIVLRRNSTEGPGDTTVTRQSPTASHEAGGTPNKPARDKSAAPKGVVRKLGRSIGRLASPVAPGTKVGGTEHKAEPAPQRVSSGGEPATVSSNVIHGEKVHRRGLASIARKLIFRKPGGTRPSTLPIASGDTTGDLGVSRQISPSGTARHNDDVTESTPVRRRGSDDGPTTTLPTDSTEIRRKPDSSILAAEPMAHARDRAGKATDIQRPVHSTHTTGAQGPKPEDSRRKDISRKPAKSTGFSPVRRLISRTRPDTRGTPAPSAQRSMDRPALTHSRGPAPNMQAIVDTAQVADDMHSISDTGPVYSESPRRTLRGVDSHRVASPSAERPKLGVSKPIIHRQTVAVSAPTAQGNAREGDTMKGVANAIKPRHTRPESRERIKRAVEPHGKSPGAPDVTVQRLPDEQPVNHIQRASVPLEEGDSATPFTGEEIDYLSSRVYMYIKRKLRTDRERSGNPGFALWR